MPAARKPPAKRPARKSLSKPTAAATPEPAARPAHRPPYAPTDKDRASVKAMAAYGIDQDQIAAILKIAPKSLRKHFRHELDHAASEANAKMAEALFKKGLAGDVIAMIFWLKARARWSERIIVQDGGLADDADPAGLSDAEIEARLAKLHRTAVMARAGKSAGTVH